MEKIEDPFLREYIYQISGIDDRYSHMEYVMSILLADDRIKNAAPLKYDPMTLLVEVLPIYTIPSWVVNSILMMSDINFYIQDESHSFVVVELY